MKSRIASSIALAAAILLGASGCGLFAPQGTTDQYAPSDGIDVDIADIAVRNLLLVASEDGEIFNVTFTGVNPSESPVSLTINFVSEDGAAEASGDFLITPGSQFFGDLEGEVEPVLVSIPNLAAGQTVTAYLQVPGSTDVERQVPVLDGTLAEYAPLVPSPSMLVAPDEEVATDEGADAGSEGDVAEEESAE